jgi:hypothetical protein
MAFTAMTAPIARPAISPTARESVATAITVNMRRNVCKDSNAKAGEGGTFGSVSPKPGPSPGNRLKKIEAATAPRHWLRK